MKISLAGWSLVRRFRRAKDPLALLDFPRTAKEEFGIDAVELNNVFFASTDEEYLDRLVASADRHGVRMVGMAVDETEDLAALDDQARRRAVAAYGRWFPIARRLGLPYLRANTGGYGNEGDLKALHQCIESFKELVAEAERHGVKLAIENHGGLSRDPERILAILEAVDSPLLGTLPDFGNFDEAVRYEGIARLAPYALGVHVKAFEFDETGEDRRIDVGRGIRLVREAGYDGYWGIEFGGKGDDHEGVVKAKALIEKHVGAV